MHYKINLLFCIASTRVKKHFQHQIISTKPHRLSYSKPILFPGRILRTTQRSNLAHTRDTELTNLLTFPQHGIKMTIPLPQFDCGEEEEDVKCNFGDPVFDTFTYDQIQCQRKIIF